MIATENGLWALVLLNEVSDLYRPARVIVGADFDALCQIGRNWHSGYDVIPASIDWPSLDPQEVPQCVKSAV